MLSVSLCLLLVCTGSVRRCRGFIMHYLWSRSTTLYSFLSVVRFLKPQRISLVLFSRSSSSPMNYDVHAFSMNYSDIHPTQTFEELVVAAAACIGAQCGNSRRISATKDVHTFTLTSCQSTSLTLTSPLPSPPFSSPARRQEGAQPEHKKGSGPAVACWPMYRGKM